MVNNLRLLAKWSSDISRDLLTQFLYFKMLRTMGSLCVPNFDSAPSSMPKLQQIVPGHNLLEYYQKLKKGCERKMDVREKWGRAWRFLLSLWLLLPTRECFEKSRLQQGDFENCPSPCYALVFKSGTQIQHNERLLPAIISVQLIQQRTKPLFKHDQDIVGTLRVVYRKSNRLSQSLKKAVAQFYFVKYDLSRPH